MHTYKVLISLIEIFVYFFITSGHMENQTVNCETLSVFSSEVNLINTAILCGSINMQSKYKINAFFCAYGHVYL